MDLKALGIDMEGLRGQIVDRAAEWVVAELGHNIQRDVRKAVEKDIGLKINALVEEALDGIYQPIDDYGQPAGAETTLRGEFKLGIREWWDQKVDNNGEPAARRYSGQPRHEYVMKKVLSDVLTRNLSRDLKRLIQETKSQVREGITETVRLAVERTWGK